MFVCCVTKNKHYVKEEILNGTTRRLTRNFKLFKEAVAITAETIFKDFKNKDEIQTTENSQKVFSHSHHTDLSE